MHSCIAYFLGHQEYKGKMTLLKDKESFFPVLKFEPVFVNQPTSESLSEDVIFKLNLKDKKGVSYAKPQEKEHYSPGSKSELLQRLILAKCLSTLPYLS